MCLNGWCGFGKGLARPCGACVENVVHLAGVALLAIIHSVLSHGWPIKVILEIVTGLFS